MPILVRKSGHFVWAFKLIINVMYVTLIIGTLFVPTVGTYVGM